MDSFTQAGQSFGCPKVVTCSYVVLCGAGLVAMVLSFVIYLGIYAFNNPNPPCWFSESTGLTGVDPTLDPAVTIIGEVTDVH